MQTLTRNATAGLLQKLVYLNNGRIKLLPLYEEYKKQLGAESLDFEEIKALLDEMVDKKLIHRHDESFYLSTSRIQTIDKTREESRKRKERVVENYFSQLYSNTHEILNWLDDVLIRFFEGYSSEWISDLYYKKNYISQSKESLLNMVRQRTLKCKDIDHRDRGLLPERFVDMLLASNDSDVNQLLWEYGTTAFSAKLITSNHGANPVALDTFKDSVCLLDTNVLMNIGLEESNYYKTLSSLETVFDRLGISVKILPITRDEYLYTIQNVKNDIIKLISRGYSDEVLIASGDQYIRTAIQRKCETEEDYERFFEDLLKVPECFHEKLSITLEDDPVVIDCVEKSLCDEQKVAYLDNLHGMMHNDRKKAQHSLQHDVGLIAGAEQMRLGKKAFILSQDSTIAAYSKRKPLEQGLTLSLQLETLINVLALDNGGVEVDPQNYIPLFAQMIRQGLEPDSKSFQPQDLTRMSEMEQEISRLPDSDIIKLASSIAAKRQQGESEEAINLAFRRELQDVKRSIVDDLEETKRNVDKEKQEKERLKGRTEKTERGLEIEVRRRVKKEVNSHLLYRVLTLVFFAGIIPGIFIILNFIKNWAVLDETWKNILMSVGVELIVLSITSIFIKPCQLIKDYKRRSQEIEERVKKELSKYEL